MSHLSGRRLATALVVLIVVVQGVMLFAFAWPGSNAGPREVPVAVAGPPQATGQIVESMRAVPGGDDDTAAFDVVEAADADAAEQAIQDRDVYGAVVVTPQGPEVLVATGAGTAVSQLLESAAGELAEESPLPTDAAPPDGAPTDAAPTDAVPVTDVAPGHAGDPNGGGLAAGVLPLVMTSAGAGVALGLAVRGLGTRLLALTGLGVLGGLAAAAILQYGIDALPGPYVALGGGLALLITAVTAGVAGLSAALGRVGAGLGILTMLFLGNPLSAATSAPEMIPGGSLGQALPPGAGVTLVRSLSFFDGSGVGTPLLVLGAWLVGGVLLLIVGTALRRSSEPTDTAEPASPAPVATEPATGATSAANGRVEDAAETKPSSTS